MNIFIYLTTFFLLVGCGSPQQPSAIDLRFDAGRRYLLIPVEESAPECEMYVMRDGVAASPRMNIRLADSYISYWVPVSIGDFQSGSVGLRIIGLEDDNAFVDSIATSDEFYFDTDEQFRPSYHFSPSYGWMNDPNGMVWHNGEYHLFYQYNPYGSMWGNMHWGHAVSRDLFKWEHLSVALAPDSLGTIFSGSAVVDHENTAGFGTDAMVAIYTSAGRTQQQSIAQSVDNGRTFTKYVSNPVLANDSIPDFRDPKVFWHDDSSRWVMTLATGQTVTFYSSPDLKEWEPLSSFGDGIGSHEGVWECPDLFPLDYNGHRYWVLLVSINPGGPNGGSATQYFIGDFNGQSFTANPLPYPLWLDHGRDNYAGVTWSDTPEGRRIFIGWMSNWQYANSVPTLRFRSANTLPRELRLTDNGAHLVVASSPVAESASMRDKTTSLGSITLADGSRTIDRLVEGNNGAWELTMTVHRDRDDKAPFSFILSNRLEESLRFTFDPEAGLLSIDRSESGATNFSDHFSTEPIVAPFVPKPTNQIRLFIDRASSELFLDDGELVSTNIVFPSAPYNTLSFESSSKIRIDDITIHTIK